MLEVIWIKSKQNNQNPEFTCQTYLKIQGILFFP